MLINYTYSYKINDEYLSEYLGQIVDTYGIINIDILNSTQVKITTEEELTSAQQVEIITFLDNFTNTSLTSLTLNILQKCEGWCTAKIREFEITNVARKNKGLMGRQELYNIMKEMQDSLIYMCLKESSLDTLKGILEGFPEETVNEVTWTAKPAYNFQYIWQEDLDKMKNDLNAFLGELYGN